MIRMNLSGSLSVYALSRRRIVAYHMHRQFKCRASTANELYFFEGGLVRSVSGRGVFEDFVVTEVL